MFEIYCAKLNTEKFVINSKNAYEQELESNETLANKIQNPNGAEKDIRKILNKKMESDKLIYELTDTYRLNEDDNDEEEIDMEVNYYE